LPGTPRAAPGWFCDVAHEAERKTRAPLVPAPPDDLDPVAVWVPSLVELKTALQEAGLAADTRAG
jgi:hypothetical protein